MPHDPPLSAENVADDPQCRPADKRTDTQHQPKVRYGLSADNVDKNVDKITSK